MKKLITLSAVLLLAPAMGIQATESQKETLDQYIARKKEACKEDLKIAGGSSFLTALMSYIAFKSGGGYEAPVVFVAFGIIPGLVNALQEYNEYRKAELQKKYAKPIEALD